jgi:hypothetical protein
MMMPTAISITLPLAMNDLNSLIIETVPFATPVAPAVSFYALQRRVTVTQLCWRV